MCYADVAKPVSHKQVDEIEHVINEHDGKVVICAFDDDQTICGYACVSDDGKEATVEELYVEPRSRRAEFGTKLLRAARLYASEMGCDTISLRVMLANANAQKLYEKEGFSYVAVFEMCGAYSMQRPVSQMVLHAGQLLSVITNLDAYKNAKIGEILEENAQNGQFLADWVNSYNSNSKVEKVDMDLFIKAGRLLDESDGSRPKIMQIARDYRNKTGRNTLELPAQVACECLIQNESAAVKRAGKTYFSSKNLGSGNSGK